MAVANRFVPFALVVVLVVGSGAGQCAAQEAQLQAAWSAAAKRYAAKVASFNHAFGASVQAGRPVASPAGTVPPVNLSVSFDTNNKVNLDAVPASMQFAALQSVQLAFVDAAVSALLQQQPTSDGQLTTLFSGLLPQAFTSFSSFIKQYVGSMIVLAGEGGTFEGGGGLGFGVNVLDCKLRPVLEMGAGIGFGFRSVNVQSSIFPTLSSGIGGGGGISMYKYDASANASWVNATVLKLGGGGGGGLRASNGRYTPDFGTTPDQNQTAPASIAAALAHVHQTACQPLTVSGSGGGGGGFVAFSPLDPVGNMNFGGGAVFGLGAAYPDGGRTPAQHGAGDGAAIGKVYSQCRVKCQNLVSPTSGQSFYACFCPCTRIGLERLGAPWAKAISCTVAPADAAFVQPGPARSGAGPSQQ